MKNRTAASGKEPLHSLRMCAHLRLVAVAVVLALLACTAFAPSVVADLTEEVLSWSQEERAHSAELPAFDPASGESRSLLARNVNALMATAWHWVDPFHKQGHVAEVLVPPPKV